MSRAEDAVALLWCEDEAPEARWAICFPARHTGVLPPPNRWLWRYTTLDCFTDRSGALWLAEDIDSPTRYEIAPGGWLSRVRL